MKDCPKREKLSDIVAESSKDGDGDSESPTRVTPLQLLTAIQTDKTPTPRGLMYVKAFVNAVYSDHSKKEGKQVGLCECACAVAQGRSAVA